MGLTLTPFVVNKSESAPPEALCSGHAWVVSDEDLLARQIAHVALGQARHLTRVLEGTGLAPTIALSTTVASAERLLTPVSADDPYHRDGWMFQVMSWIAAHKCGESSIISLPHMIHAEKGFDGIQVNLDAHGNVSAVVIFEDKATENPRRTIKQDVWPELAKFENGEYENVLASKVSELLAISHVPDPELAVEKIVWSQSRQYRVSITVADSHADEDGHARLFKNFDDIVPGDCSRRRGQTLYVQNLRSWMRQLADRSITHVRSLGAGNV